MVIIYEFPVEKSMVGYEKSVASCGIVTFMSDPADYSTTDGRLRAAWKAAGYNSAADVAKRTNIPYSTFAGHSNGSAGIPVEALKRYADVFRVNIEWLMTGRGRMMREQTVLVGESVTRGLAVVGKAQPGIFVDAAAAEMGQDRRIPVMPLVQFFKASQYALEVVGDSVGDVLAEGEFAVCVEYPEPDLGLKGGSLVHIERHRDAGQLVETTIKELQQRGNDWWAIPRSKNPKWQGFRISGDDSVVIKGIVTGVYRRIAF
jgi:SOS-response transcriptional repressor LexA